MMIKYKQTESDIVFILFNYFIYCVKIIFIYYYLSIYLFIHREVEKEDKKKPTTTYFVKHQPYDCTKITIIT